MYSQPQRLPFLLLFVFGRDLLSEFHSSLSDLKKNKPLVMLVDGVDLVRDSGGQLTSDWIPQQLPKVRKNTHTLIHS